MFYLIFANNLKGRVDTMMTSMGADLSRHNEEDVRSTPVGSVSNSQEDGSKAGMLYEFCW